MKLDSIKLVLQKYWEDISYEKRREILYSLVFNKELPNNHPIFKGNDIPYECALSWIEEIVAKKDLNLEYCLETC